MLNHNENFVVKVWTMMSILVSFIGLCLMSFDQRAFERRVFLASRFSYNTMGIVGWVFDILIISPFFMGCFNWTMVGVQRMVLYSEILKYRTKRTPKNKKSIASARKKLAKAIEEARGTKHPEQKSSKIVKILKWIAMIIIVMYSSGCFKGLR